MRRSITLALAGTLGIAAGVAACGDDPTRPGPLGPIAVARDIGDSATVFGWAEDVNASGQVAGWRLTSGGEMHYTPYLWSESGGMQNLGRLPGTSGHAMAGAINDRGDVVGISGDRPFLWTASGGMRDLGLPTGAVSAVPLDVAEDGRVAGTWRDAGGTPHAFVWTAEAGMRDLPVPASMAWASAWGVNSHGQVAGTGCASPCADESLTRALVWPATGEPLDLGLQLGVRSSQAIGITDQGVVAGTLQRRAGGPWTAFTWSASAGLRELGTLPGEENSWAHAIGEGGHVVGSAGSRAFVWTAQGGMRDLGMVPGADTTTHSAQATGVNRWGQAVGTIRNPSSPRPVLFVNDPVR